MTFAFFYVRQSKFRSLFRDLDTIRSNVQVVAGEILCVIVLGSLVTRRILVLLVISSYQPLIMSYTDLSQMSPYSFSQLTSSCPILIPQVTLPLQNSKLNFSLRSIYSGFIASNRLALIRSIIFVRSIL